MKQRPTKRKRNPQRSTEAGGGPQRIQKALAQAGVASRRAIEELIRAGRVSVNGEPAHIGQKVQPGDRVLVDNKGIALARTAPATRVLAYKKRTGEIVTRADPDGRRTVFRKLPELEGSRWIAIGRLDINTSGLLLFTNSGELARRLMHPSFEIEREYAVRVLGEVDDAMLQQLQDGVRLEDGNARFEKVWRSDGPGPDDDAGQNGDAHEFPGKKGDSPIFPAGKSGQSPANRWFQVVVKQGRNRLVRRLWESQRCQVSRLMRVRYGPVELGRGIRSAGYRELEAHEVRALERAVGIEAPATPGRRPRS
ncbi:MAG TPA: pseudouridine synthase [Verrucomicrobiae bacterium]|nr:pseudouridine synthase [Verrucomicrobiae bacterium]